MEEISVIIRSGLSLLDVLVEKDDTIFWYFKSFSACL